MNQVLKRIGLTLFFLVLIFYVGYQLSRGFSQGYTTEVALSYVASDSSSASCVLIRSETVLEQEVSGVVEHLYPDGERVSKNEAVALIYDSEAQVRNKARISDLQNEISVLKNSGDLSSAGLIQADLLAKKINQQMTELIGYLENGDAKSVNSARYELQVSLNKKKAITDGQVDFSARLGALNQELDTLSRIGTGSKGSVVAPSSGYYVGSVDGYEGTLTPESIETLTLSDVEKILSRSDIPSDTDFSKILSEFTWYCAAVGRHSLAKRLYNGMNVNIVFPFESHEVPGTLVSFTEYPEEDRVLMIFSCDYMSEDLSSVRKSAADITFRNYSGIRVRQEAIRFGPNNEEGVYVKVGEKVVFKKLDVLYRGDGFVLSAAKGSGENDYLKLFDEIIVEGKDLYDGKILTS